MNAIFLRKIPHDVLIKHLRINKSIYLINLFLLVNQNNFVHFWDPNESYVVI